jgi:hypothetical protein
MQLLSINKYGIHLRPEASLTNNETIGIEVVGMYNNETQEWDALTNEQVKTVSWLVNSLLKTTKLKKENIYNHEDIQAKTPGEGQVVYDAIKNNIIDDKLTKKKEKTNTNSQYVVPSITLPTNKRK